jgi:hypothetical protein
MGIMERIDRYKLAEKCAAFTPEIIEFWVSVLRNGKLPHALRMQAADGLMDRGFGRPAIAMTVDQTSMEMGITKIVQNAVGFRPTRATTRSASPRSRIDRATLDAVLVSAAARSC